MAETPVSIQLRQIFLRGLCGLSLSVGLSAAPVTPQASTVSAATASKAAPAPAASKAALIKPEETLLFTQASGHHRVLGRIDAAGRCKAYLGNVDGGWVGFADPKLSGNDYQAVSNADGSRLALLSDRNGAVNLWLLNGEGHDWKMMTDDDGGIMDASQASGPVLAFSPDGKYLAVIRRGALWVLALNGDQPRTLTPERGVRSLAWSPDSLWIAYERGSSVHKVSVNGLPDRLLSNELADDDALAWHPDPKQELLFFLGGGLRKVDGRARVTLLVPSASHPNSVAVLPGGKQVALLVPAANGKSEVSLASLGAKNLSVAQVTQEGAEGVLASNDPKALYFIRDGVAWHCDLNGTHARPLGSIPMGAIRVGMLPPLKGVCP